MLGAVIFLALVCFLVLYYSLSEREFRMGLEFNTTSREQVDVLCLRPSSFYDHRLIGPYWQISRRVTCIVQGQELRGGSIELITRQGAPYGKMPFRPHPRELVGIMITITQVASAGL